jgi:hypothetical protein
MLTAYQKKLLGTINQTVWERVYTSSYCLRWEKARVGARAACPIEHLYNRWKQVLLHRPAARLLVVLIYCFPGKFFRGPMKKNYIKGEN